jgi:transposase-like protein
MKRKVNFYPDDFKLKVVQEYLATDISRDAIMAKYGIGGHNCINNWMRKFGMRAPSQEQLKLQRHMSNESAKTAREKILESKLHALEQELEHEKLRNEALNTLIDVAEKEFKLAIRKKPGTKQ